MMLSILEPIKLRVPITNELIPRGYSYVFRLRHFLEFCARVDIVVGPQGLFGGWGKKNELLLISPRKTIQ